MKRISKSRRSERTNSFHLTRSHIINNVDANLISNQINSLRQQQVIYDHDNPLNNKELYLEDIFDEQPSQKSNCEMLECLPLFQESIFSHNDDLTNEISIDKETNNHDENERVFNGSQLLTREASLYVFTFSNRHNLTRAASEDLVKMIQSLLPNPNYFPKTLYSLEKQIGFEKVDISIKNYCQNCRLEFFIGPLNSEQKESEFCGCFHEEERKLDCFLYTNVYDKIKFLVKQYFDSIYKYCSSQRSFQDIIDGEFYKKINKENSLHLMICADGTPLRKSSKMKEFWPVILSLIELPRSLRDSIKNKIISGKFLINIITPL